MDAHTKRRLSLARWYASEHIVNEARGDPENAAQDLASAAEYLSALLGRPVTVETPEEIVALCCAIELGELAETAA